MNSRAWSSQVTAQLATKEPPLWALLGNTVVAAAVFSSDDSDSGTLPTVARTSQNNCLAKPTFLAQPFRTFIHSASMDIDRIADRRVGGESVHNYASFGIRHFVV